MKTRNRLWLAEAALSLTLSACASGPDHFYRLQALPASPVGPSQHQFVAEVAVRLSIPSMVDRSQMVLDQGSSVQVLEHERWAAPLVDQLHAVLGQDLELRRPDVLVTARPQSVDRMPRVIVQVEIVALTMRRGSAVQMEVRWHVAPIEGESASPGRELFTATPTDTTPAALAMALSECVAQLAERLALQIVPA